MKIGLMMIILMVSMVMPQPSAENVDGFFIEPQIETQEEIITIEEPEEEVIQQNENLIEHIDDLDTSVKTWMDYRAITDTSSPQWRLQQDAYTDENGLRKVGDYYCVAFGTGISNGIGSKFKVTFDNGNEILVIVADHKADRHTDKTNTYMKINNKANIMEFIVDSNKLDNTAKVMGDVNYISGFEGQIIYIEGVDE